jgi:dihydrolipoamide dehydrogenase
VRLSAPPELDLMQVVRWKDGVVDRLNGGVAGLLKRHKVRVVSGAGVFTDAKTCLVGDLEIRAETVILAAGSAPSGLRDIPFGDQVISSTEALDLKVLPRRLLVVGAGYIGLELGIAYRKFGSEVTLVEAQGRILPLYDAALTAPVAAHLKRAGIETLLGARALGWSDGTLELETAEGPRRLGADQLLITVGRRPATEGWGLETMGVDMDGPFVKVDDHCRTSMSGVYAVGDLVGEPMLEHKAAAQGHAVAETVGGRPTRFDPAAVAVVCFTEPEIVSAGLSPEAAERDGNAVLVGVFPFQANGRALSMDAGADGGFVRVVASARDHRLLGLQAVGRHVSELAGEFALALEMGAVLEDVAGTIHVHPTLGEAVHEAALRALGHAIHI